MFIGMVSLSGCAREGSKNAPVVILPRIVHYDGHFQEKLLNELDEIKVVACPPTDVPENCSAVLRVILDYADLREKLRPENF